MTTNNEDLPVSDRIGVYRLLDANFNRSFEALRVIEDIVRFSFDNILITEQIKEMRHGLKAIILAVGPEIMTCRDVASDVGSDYTIEDEKKRGSQSDIMSANFGRLKEAMRVLEETTKLVMPEASGALKRIRYQVYNLEKRSFILLKPRPLLENAFLYVIVTGSLAGGNPLGAVRGAIAGGADIIQLREPEMNQAEFLKLARGLQEITTAEGVLFIVNDRVDAAILTHADGVHLGQDDLPVPQARKLLGPDRIIGKSIHSVDEALKAASDGADYLGVGAVFPSTTKPQVEVGGLELVAAVREKVPYLPLFAIGGINPGNVADVMETGVRRVAVSGAIVGAPDVRAAAQRIRKHLPPRSDSE